MKSFPEYTKEQVFDILEIAAKGLGYELSCVDDEDVYVLAADTGEFEFTFNTFSSVMSFVANNSSILSILAVVKTTAKSTNSSPIAVVSNPFITQATVDATVSVEPKTSDTTTTTISTDTVAKVADTTAADTTIQAVNTSTDSTTTQATISVEPTTVDTTQVTTAATDTTTQTTADATAPQAVNTDATKSTGAAQTTTTVVVQPTSTNSTTNA